MSVKERNAKIRELQSTIKYAYVLGEKLGCSNVDDLLLKLGRLKTDKWEEREEFLQKLLLGIDRSGSEL